VGIFQGIFLRRAGRNGGHSPPYVDGKAARAQGDQVAKERRGQNGSWIGTFVHMQMAGQSRGVKSNADGKQVLREAQKTVKAL